MPDASLWLVAYDIANPARLRSVATRCEDYGRRLQQSVFLCNCTTEKIRELRGAITEQIVPAADHFVLMALCRRCTDNIMQEGLQKAIPGTTTTMVI